VLRTVWERAWPGVDVRQEFGQRTIEHGGEVSGFTAHNMVFPDARIVLLFVMVNEDSGRSPRRHCRQDRGSAFPRGLCGKQEDQSREIFAALQQGKIKSRLVHENCNSYFTEQALKDFASSLGPLGTPASLRQTYKQDRGG